MTMMGEWMVNAIRKESDPEYEDALSKILAACQGTSLQYLATFDDDSGLWIPSEVFEEEAQALIDEYDDKTFWEEITARLTERDLMQTLGESAVRSMHPDKRAREAERLAKAYTQEFETEGLDRLHVVTS